jgi:multiple sugar transport system permease protein
MTVPVGLATVQGSFGIRYADTMASAVLGAIPLIAVFLLFQRHIVEGIAGTGLKG